MDTRRRRRRGAAAIVAACAGGYLAASARPAKAATLTWTNGGGDQLWLNSANWGGTAAAGNDLVFGTNAAAVTQGLVDNSLTSSISISSLLYNQSYIAATTPNVFHTTSITNGVTLTITGTNALHVGLLNAASTGANVNGLQTITTMTGGGSLVVSNTNTTAIIAVTNDTLNGTSGTSYAVLDMSGLSRFSATSAAFIIGGAASGLNAAGGRSQGTVILADTNVLNTSNITVGWTNGNNRFSSLTLGRSNTINVDTFYVGREKAQATVQFGTGFTSAANLVLRGTGTNTRVANVIVADLSAQSSSGTTPGQTTLDLRGGTVDAQITNLTVGVGQSGTVTGTGSSQGTVFFGNGVMDVTTITLGKTVGTNAATTGRGMGTLTVSGGTVKAGSIVLGQQAATSTAFGFFNVNGGNVQVTGNILDGNGTSSLVINGGTISTVANIGSGTQSIDTFALTSGSIGTVGNMFVSTISGSGTISNLTGALTLNQGTNAQAFAGSISGAGGLVKNGNSVLTLSGTNNFTGSTTINAGTVALSGAGTLAGTQTILMANGATLDVSGVAGGPYTLNSGQTITGIAGAGGTGNIKGAFSLNGGATLMPGGSNTVGTLAFGSDLTLSDKSTLNYDLGATTAAGASDLITVGGNLALSGTTLVSISRLAADVANGTYQLMTYAGALTGDASNLVVGGVSGVGTRHTYTVDTSTAGAINLVVAGSGPANLVWTGANSTLWNVQGDQNWTNGGTPDQFFQQDNVTFDDSSSVTNVTLAQVLQPSNVNVTANQNYTFSGTGSISGNATLTKSGNGTLTIANSGTNDYIGATVINGGTLQVGNGGTAGNLPAGFPVTNNANLAFNRSDSVTFGGNISGSGNVQQLGTGTLSLGGTNTYSGTTTVAAGVLRTLTPTALGSTAGATIVQPGATLDVGGQNLGAEQIFVSGTGVAGLNGAIVNSGADQINALQFVTMTGNATVGGNGGRWDVRSSGTAVLDMGGFALTKAGTNYVALVNTSVLNPGTINVNAGTFSIEASTNLGGGATNTLNANGGILQLWGTTSPMAWSLQANGATIKGGSGTGNNWSGPVALNANTTFDIASGVTVNVSGNVSGTGTLSKVTAGALQLTGNNSGWSGTIGLTAGTLSVNSDAALGAVPASPVNDITALGSSTLQFTTSFNPATNRNILISGTGTTLTFDNGTNNVTLGQVISGSGNFTKNGGTAQGVVTLTGVNTFTGNVTVSQGQLTITNSQALGTTSGSNAKTVTMTAGTAGNPSIHLNGVAAPINLGTNVAFVTSNSSGSIFNDAGDNSIAGTFTLASGGGNTVIEVDGGTLMLTGNMSANTTLRNLVLQGPGNGTMTGSLSNANTPGFQKSGTGTWTLTGAHAYTGATVVNGGALVVHGSIAAGSAVAVSNNAILGGGVGATAGVIGGTVTVSAGTISPGANGTNGSAISSTGILKAGAVAFSATSGTAFQVDITGAGNGVANAGATYDELFTTSATGISGTNVRLVLNDASFAPAAGDTFVIARGVSTAANTISFINFDGSTIDGTGVTQFLSSAGNAYTLNVNGSDGSGNTAVVLTAVPEPTTLALMGVASVGLMARRRRRKQR